MSERDNDIEDLVVFVAQLNDVVYSLLPLALIGLRVMGQHPDVREQVDAALRAVLDEDPEAPLIHRFVRSLHGEQPPEPERPKLWLVVSDSTTNRD